MPVTPSLSRFIDDELSRTVAMAQTTVDLTLADLRQRREAASGAADRDQHHAVIQALAREKAAFVRRFDDTLRSTVRAEMEDAAAPPAAAPGVRGLELMDEIRVEADIAISGAAQRIGGAADWELRELQSFMSTLAGLPHVVAEINPLTPLGYARALWDATAAVTTAPAERRLLARSATTVLAGQLRKAWAAACTRLEASGVEPCIYRTLVLAHGAAVAQEPVYDVTRPGGLEGLLSSMPGAGGASPSGHSSAGPAPALQAALDHVEATLEQAAAGSAAASGVPSLGEHRVLLLDSASGTVDRQIVELLSRLFDAVLCDTRLPAHFRPAMARLQVSALRVALVDPATLSSHDHAVWRLVNRIASAAEDYPQPADPRGAALRAFCETLADDIARAPVQNASPYRQGVARLEAFLGEQLREQQQRAQPAIETLMRLEEREAVERRLSQLLGEQLAPIATVPLVRRFVTTTWAQVLAGAIQEHGEKGEETLAWMRTTDDLLWSLRLPDHPQSRKRLLAMLPGLLQRLREGLGLIAVPESEQRPVFDALMAVHAEALRPGKTETPATPQQIVQQLRDETDWRPPHRPPFSDSLIDLPSMETVPADMLPAMPRSPDDPGQGIDSLQPGDRRQLFVRGRWDRVRLLWRSERGGYLLFAGTDAQPWHSVTRRALERLDAEGLLEPIDAVSLVQRAVDDLMRRLTVPGA